MNKNLTLISLCSLPMCVCVCEYMCACMCVCICVWVYMCVCGSKGCLHYFCLTGHRVEKLLFLSDLNLFSLQMHLTNLPNADETDG